MYLGSGRGFDEYCLEVYKFRSDHLSNNLRLNEISILTFSDFTVKQAEKNYN